MVSVVKCENYDANIVSAAMKAVLEPLGGLEWVHEGMTIAIKANLVSGMHPDRAATTHPTLLCSLVEMLKSRGARVIVGDSPGGLFNHAYVNRVYAATGMKVLENAGAELNQDFSQKQVHFDDAKIAKDFTYTAWLDKADAIINFCKLKTHGMMAMSACVKNMFGVVPGTYKPEYHYKYPEHAKFADMLVDLNVRFPQQLVIVDAVTGMEGNGPTAGTPRHIGAILASDSPYACDRICAKVIGIDESELETIQAAEKRGFNDEITVFGDVEQFIVPDYELVRTRKETDFGSGHKSLIGGIVGKFIHYALCSIPSVKKKECIGCKKCMNICPAKAIEMKRKKPVIDRKKCIRCFCCQEFCPVGAMKVKRPLIARLLNR